MILVFSFQFLLICILPRFIQWTYCPQTLKEVTYSIYIQCRSWNCYKFNFYEMLELELISNSIYIQWWSWNWFQIQFIYNAEVGVDSVLRLFSHSWRKKEKIIFALLSLYLLFSKIMEKHKPKPRILTELLQSAKPRQSQS